MKLSHIATVTLATMCIAVVYRQDMKAVYGGSSYHGYRRSIPATNLSWSGFTAPFKEEANLLKQTIYDPTAKEVATHGKQWAAAGATGALAGGGQGAVAGPGGATTGAILGAAGGIANEVITEKTGGGLAQALGGSAALGALGGAAEGFALGGGSGALKGAVLGGAGGTASGYTSTLAGD